MSTMKPEIEAGSEAAPRTVERRSFIWKAAAALTGTVAAAAAMGSGSAPPVATATGDSEEINRLSNQLGQREDADEIRQLHRAFGAALNERRYEDLVRLFAQDARVH